MFEKEAEEYVMREDIITENNRVPFDNGYGFQTVSFEDEVKKGFQDGAEFGYNKANEWHYVKDELPPEDVPLLLVRGGKIYVAWYWDNVYHDSRCCQVKKPYAWKEIVLPKEIE